MQRSACLLHVSFDQVYGVWHGASWSGGQGFEAAASFTASGAPSLGDAIEAVLAATLPPRRFASPYVRVSLEGPHIMAAILAFAKLPKAKADRRLVVSQRFCREHRLEPGTVEIVGSPVQSSKTGTGRMLCLAVQRDMLQQIETALAGRGLHADTIAPNWLLKLGQTRSQLETPGIALFEEKSFRTILVWDEQGAIAHVATVKRPARDDLEGQRRMAMRIRRYAQIVTREDDPVAVYVDGLTGGGIAPDVDHWSGLKLLQWPRERGAFRRAAR